MFVRSFVTFSAVEERHSVLLHRYTSEPLSSRFADMRLLHISATITMFAAGDVILAAVGSLLLQSDSTLATYDIFCHGHALNTMNSTKHDRDCTRQTGFPRTDEFSL